MLYVIFDIFVFIFVECEVFCVVGDFVCVFDVVFVGVVVVGIDVRIFGFGVYVVVVLVVLVVCNGLCYGLL